MEAQRMQSNLPLDTAVEAKATTWRDLPDHLLEAIGTHVYGNDYLTARLVCHLWRRALSPVTRTVKVHLHHRQLDPVARLRAVQDAFPRASRMAMYVDANITGGVDLKAACCGTLHAMADTTALELPAHQQQPTSELHAMPSESQKQQYRTSHFGIAGKGERGITEAAANGVMMDCKAAPCDTSGGGPGPPSASGGSGMLAGASGDSSMGSPGVAGSSGGDGPCGAAAAGGRLMWQFMSVTVGATVLPLNRDQPDLTTHRLMSSCQWVGRQLAAAFAASQPALCRLRHLTTLELTSDTALFAALLPHLAQRGAAPSLTELRFTRAEASRSSLGRWLAVAGAPPAGDGRGASGEDTSGVPDALGALTGLKSLALNAGLPGLPAAVLRLSHLSALELQHSGRGVAIVEDVAPLEALTGLTSLKLRYVALRHTWQLTRLTALTCLDLTLRAFYSSDVTVDGEEDPDEIDEMDAVMGEDWFGPAPPAAPAGGDPEGPGQMVVAAAAAAAAAAIAMVAPAGQPAGAFPSAAAAAAPGMPPNQPPSGFIVPAAQRPPLPQPPQYGPWPQPPGAGAGMHLMQWMFLFGMPPLPHVPSQGPSGLLPPLQAPWQPHPAQQPAGHLGPPASGPAVAVPGAVPHPNAHISLLQPTFASFHNHTAQNNYHYHPRYGPYYYPPHHHHPQPQQQQQQQQQQQHQQHEPQHLEHASLELQRQQQHPSQEQQQQQQPLGSFSQWHFERGVDVASTSRALPSIALPVGTTSAVGGFGAASLCNSGGAAGRTAPPMGPTSTRPPYAQTATITVTTPLTSFGYNLIDSNFLHEEQQAATGATAHGQGGGSSGSGPATCPGTMQAPGPGSMLASAAATGAAEDVSGRQPGCSAGGSEPGTRGGGGSGDGAVGGKHHVGFGSWMFGDSGRESDSDGAVTFSLASSAAGSDWYVEDDGAGREAGGAAGSGSIAGTSADRQARRGADDGRVGYANALLIWDGAAGGGASGSGAGVSGGICRVSPASAQGPRTAANGASASREAHGTGTWPGLAHCPGDDADGCAPAASTAAVLSPSAAQRPPFPQDIPTERATATSIAAGAAACAPAGGAASMSQDAQHFANGPYTVSASLPQAPVSSGPFGSIWGSGSSGTSSTSTSSGGSRPEDGIVPMELGSFDIEEAPHTSGQAERKYVAGTVSTVIAAEGLAIKRAVLPLAVSAALPTAREVQTAGSSGEAGAQVPAASSTAADAVTAAATLAALTGGQDPEQPQQLQYHHRDGANWLQAEAPNGENGAAEVAEQEEVEDWLPGGGDADAEEAEDEDDAESDEELAEAELAEAVAHDEAVSRELWRVVGALPGLRALNVNAWQEAPLDDERLGELAKLSLPTTGQLLLSGLTSLGLLLQASSASSSLSSLSDLTGLKDLTLVVAPPKGTGSRQPPPAAAAVQLSSLDFEYDSDDEHDERLPGGEGVLVASASNHNGNHNGNGGPASENLQQDFRRVGLTPNSDLDGGKAVSPNAAAVPDGSTSPPTAAPTSKHRPAAGALDADGDLRMGEPAGNHLGAQTDATGATSAATVIAVVWGSGGCVAAAGPATAAATTTTPANASDVAAAATESGSPVCHLAALTSLERLRLYDDPGVLPVDQDAAKLLSSAWSRMNDIYILGSMTLKRSSALTFSRLAHLDLFNQTSSVPYRVQLHHLPPSMRALGVQNAVLEGASRASQLQSVLEGLSLYATVHWPIRANGGIDMYEWIAGCSKLASLTIEYDMRTFADIMSGSVTAAGTGAAITAATAPTGAAYDVSEFAAASTDGSRRVPTGVAAGSGQHRQQQGLLLAPLSDSSSSSSWGAPDGSSRPLPHTPLRRLASLPALSTLGVFFADSHQELLAGVLDQRLVDDVAELAFLEELEIWNVYGTDWNFQRTDFTPLARLSRLRSLKMEALPPFMAFRIRRVMQEGVPYCKLRLVADNEMPPVVAPAAVAGGGLPLQAIHQQQAAAVAAIEGAMGTGGGVAEAPGAVPEPGFLGPLQISAAFHQEQLQQQEGDPQRQLEEN